MKKGLILEGGAMRGMFTAGVIDVLMENRHVVYNDTIAYIEEKEKRGELFVIRPEYELPVGRIEKDPEKLKKAYGIGRQIALENLPNIKAFLA